MPQFEIVVKRCLDHTVTITLTAADEEAASEAALTKAKTDTTLEWELQDDNYEIESLDEDDTDDSEEDEDDEDDT